MYTVYSAWRKPLYALKTRRKEVKVRWGNSRPKWWLKLLEWMWRSKQKEKKTQREFIGYPSLSFTPREGTNSSRQISTGRRNVSGLPNASWHKWIWDCTLQLPEICYSLNWPEMFLRGDTTVVIIHASRSRNTDLQVRDLSYQLYTSVCVQYFIYRWTNKKKGSRFCCSKTLLHVWF